MQGGQEGFKGIAGEETINMTYYINTEKSGVVCVDEANLDAGFPLRCQMVRIIGGVSRGVVPKRSRHTLRMWALLCFGSSFLMAAEEAWLSV